MPYFKVGHTQSVVEGVVHRPPSNCCIRRPIGPSVGRSLHLPSDGPVRLSNCPVRPLSNLAVRSGRLLGYPSVRPLDFSDFIIFQYELKLMQGLRLM